MNMKVSSFVFGLMTLITLALADGPSFNRGINNVFAHLRLRPGQGLKQFNKTEYKTRVLQHFMKKSNGNPKMKQNFIRQARHFARRFK